MNSYERREPSQIADWLSLSSLRRNWRAALFTLCATSLSVMLAASPVARAQQLRLTNPTNIDRTEEVVEIPLDQVTRHLKFSAPQLHSLVATEAATKQRIPSQLYNSRQGADPDTLVASARAYIASLNKLMVKRGKQRPEVLTG